MNDAACLEIFHAQGGVALEAGALVEMAVGVDQSLGEGLAIMRVSVNDAIGVRSMGRRGGCEEDSQGQSGTTEAA